VQFSIWLIGNNNSSGRWRSCC